MAARGSWRRRQLEQLAAGTSVPEDLTRDFAATEEFKRVIESALMAAYASQFPGRLGRAKRAVKLADKKVGRRVAWQYLQQWQGLGKVGAPEAPKNWEELQRWAAAKEQVRQAGASVDWPEWVDERLAWIPQRRARIAALALRDGELDWGWRVVYYAEEEELSLSRFDGDLDVLRKASDPSGAREASQ